MDLNYWKISFLGDRLAWTLGSAIMGLGNHFGLAIRKRGCALPANYKCIQQDVQIFVDKLSRSSRIASSVPKT